jgi:hypothetical protein
MVKRTHFVSSLPALPALAALVTAAACNVTPIAPVTTGGVGEYDAGGLDDAGNGGSVADAGGDGAADGAGNTGDSAGATACDHGSVVLLTDYASTQIALSTLDGTTQSAAFLSTASTKASGLAFALSGDVALPSMTPPSGRVVLIDRYGTNVITWADPATAHVYAQLPVGTGFISANPQDYLELDATRAYVTRWGVNDAPGAQPFDSGSDVLIIDTQTPAITGSIAMPVEDALPPRPAGMVRVGDTVIVVLQRTSETDFNTVGENALVGVKNDAIAWETHLTGLKGCDRPTLSPSGHTMAIGCEGQLDANGNVQDLSTSAIALYDVTSLPPTPMQRFAVSDQLGSAVQSGVTWVSETVLLAKTQTPVGGSTNNQAFRLDVGTGKATVLLTANPDSSGKGKGIVYGDVRCLPGCGDVCLLADADVGKLRRWTIAGGVLESMSDVTVDPATGMPPVGLGGY